MAEQATGQNPGGAWEEDPDGASILLATGRARHHLLVVAEPALLTDLDEAWGRPSATVRLSFLPGVSAPGVPGQEDALRSYDRGGLGVLVARGRTSLFEGKPSRRTTALARIAAGTGIRAALLVTRAAGLAGGRATGRPGDLLAIADHLNLTGGPLFPASTLLDAGWDTILSQGLTEIDGVGRSATVALAPGPVRPTPAEAALLAGLGADAVVTDSVAEAMMLASKGVRVAGLAYLDSLAGGGAGAPRSAPARRSGRRAAQPRVESAASAASSRSPGAGAAPPRPATAVVADAVEAVLATLR